jgi:hypothetical protein
MKNLLVLMEEHRFRALGNSLDKNIGTSGTGSNRKLQEITS